MDGDAELANRLRTLAAFLDDHGVGMGDHSDTPTYHAAADRLEALAGEVERLRAAVDDVQRRAEASRLAEHQALAIRDGYANSAAALRAALSSVMAAAGTCRRRNTPEWMAYLAGVVNEAATVLGTPGRLKYPGKWSDEFQLEVV
jgi:hypothetical protein